VEGEVSSMSSVAPRSRQAPADRGSEIRTFLIADVRGYTRFSQERGDDAAATLIAKFAELAREAVEAHEGEVEDLHGDEVLAVFASARRAIRAAVELQQTFADETALDPSLPLCVGVGLDAGEAVHAADGYRGRALNLASRFCAIAASGEVLASSQVVHLAGSLDGITYRSLGGIEIKGFDHPVEAIAAEANPELPRRTLPPTHPTGWSHLPVELDPVTPQIGREREMCQLRWLWRRAAHGRGRPCFVSGAQGIGKTRFLAELAKWARDAGWTVLYARGLGPSEPCLEVLEQSRSTEHSTLVILDDLDEGAGTVLDLLEALLAEFERRPVMFTGTFREPSPRVTRLLERAAGRGFDPIELVPLDADAVEAIAALYARNSDDTVPARLLEQARGVPAEVHRLAIEWATARAVQRVDDAVTVAADGRPRLALVEAEVATGVADLERVREQSRLYLTADEAGPVVCPFKGLATFELDDADYFFGRERLVAELTARVVGTTFLGVVGPSGSGKSSAVKAGLMHALRSGVLPKSGGWRQALIRPGERPMQSLIVAQRELGSAAGGRRVLVVDQFEELFTSCLDESERRAFVAEIAEFSRAPTSLVVVAVRADFYGRCADYPDLARRLGANNVLVGPMSQDEQRRAIELPARQAGLVVEPELVQALLADILDQPGALPLLSTKLLELWQHRQGRTLTLAAYHRTGGVRAAVAGLAERAYEKLSPEQRTRARSVLPRLAILGEDGRVARRRASLAEFDTETDLDVAAILAVFTDARLLTVTDGDVEVAHEALLREWPRLRDWLREDAHGAQLHHHLIQAARDWDAGGRDRGELYRGARLSAALDWSVLHEPALNRLELEFLEASQAVHHRELRRLRLLLAGAVSLLVLALAGGVIAYVQREHANHAAVVADAQRLGAQGLVMTQPDLGLLLAREGVNLNDSASARGDLLATLLRFPPAALHFLRPPGQFGALPDQLALTPDGLTLAVGSDNYGITFYNARTYQREGSVRVPGGANDLAFSPDGSLLAVEGGRGQGAITLLTMGAHPSVRTTLHVTHALFIVRVVFSPDGRTLAVAFARNSLTGGCGSALWMTRFDVASRRQLRPTVDVSGDQACSDVIDKLIYSPSGDRLIASNWVQPPLGKIVVYNARDLQVEREIPFPGATGMSLSPNGKTLAITTSEGTVSFMSFPNGRPRRASGAHKSGIWSAEFTPDGRSLVTVSNDDTAIVWDVKSALKWRVLKSAAEVTNEAISLDGRTLYTGSTDGTITTWDLSGTRGLGETLQFSRAYPANVDNNPQATAVAITPDGALLATAPSPAAVRVWDTETLHPAGRPLRGFREFDPTVFSHAAEDLALSPSGRLLAAGGGDGSTVVLWDIRSGRVVQHLAQSHPIRCDSNLLPPTCTSGAGLEFSPDGRTLADGDGPNGAVLWDLSNHTRSVLPVGPNNWVVSLAYAPDGRHLVTISSHNRGVLWDVARRRRLASFPAGGPQHWGPTAVAFSRDGSVFATAAGSTITLRNATTGAVAGKPITMASKFSGVLALSPDARTVAVIAVDGVEVWDTGTGAQTGSLPAASPQPSSPGGAGNLRFTPDGRRLVVVSPAGVATIWNLSPSVWLADACQIAGRNLTHAEWNRYLPNRAYQRVCP
jgi:WD40 repeat protein/class 3 adenylate cyclase